MNNILKKFSLIALLFVFVSFSCLIVSASQINDTKTEISNGNVVLSSEDEYNNLIQRIEELEQLKSREINDNLIEFYEKSNSETNSNISTIATVTSWAIAIASFVVAGLAVFNYSSSKKKMEEAEQALKEAKQALKEAKQAVNDAKEANKVIDQVSENLEITNKYMIEYDSNLIELRKKMEEIDLMKNRLNIYMKKSIAETTNDLNTKIEIYSEIIEDEHFDSVQDIQIILDRGNSYFLSATNAFRSDDENTSYFEIRKINLECFDFSLYKQFIKKAICDFTLISKINLDDKLDDPNGGIISSYKIKLATYYIFLNEMDKALRICQEITVKGEGFDELVDYLSTIIVFDGRTDILFSDRENEFVMDKVYDNLLLHREEILYLAFSEKYLDRKFESIVSELDNMKTFIKKINKVKNDYSMINISDLIDVLNRTRVGDLEAFFYKRKIVSHDTRQYIMKLDDEQFKELIDKVNEFEHIEL